MYGEYGEFFFHYTTRQAAFGDILPKRRLRLSPYSRMRDPLESTPWAFSAAYYGTGDAVEQATRASYEEAMNTLEEARRNMKVLSLTIDAEHPEAPTFGRGYARARLWEQYAENHAGVCLLFRRDQFHEIVGEQLGPRSYNGPVTYTVTGIHGQSQARFLDLGGEKQGAALGYDHLRRYHRELFFLKQADWQTEYEYRYIKPGSDQEYEYVDYGDDTLAAVIVGHQFPGWQAAGAIHEAQQAGAEILQVHWVSFRPELVRLAS